MSTNPSSVDIAKLITDAGLGVWAGTNPAGWNVYVGSEPDRGFDQTATVYDTGGQDPHPRMNIDYPNVQVRVRGKRGDYMGAFNKMQAIKDLLLGLGPVVVNTTKYVGIWQISDIEAIGESEERPLFTSNWRIIRMPVVAGNRSDC